MVSVDLSVTFGVGVLKNESHIDIYRCNEDLTTVSTCWFLTFPFGIVISILINAKMIVRNFILLSMGCGFGYMYVQTS